MGSRHRPSTSSEARSRGVLGCRTACESSQGYFPYRLPSSWLQLALFPPSWVYAPLSSLPPPLPRIQYVPTKPPRQSCPDMWTECTHCVHTHASLLDLKPTGQEINCGKTQLYYTLCKQPPNLMTPPHRGTSETLARGSPKPSESLGSRAQGLVEAGLASWMDRKANLLAEAHQ